MRLRRTSPADVGWTRRRAGRGFTYVDADGCPVPESERDRIRSLAIPPAWTEVWICPLPHGHLQAVGTDQAGRRQYLYHPHWREKRDAAKFELAQLLGSRLARARTRVGEELALEGMPLERACATAFRLLDLGCFRIGSDVYLDAHGSFGLTTIQRQHVRLRSGRLSFDFVGKSGVEHHVEIDDAKTVVALDVMRRRRNHQGALLGYRSDGRWRPLGPEQVNAYIADRTGLEVSAKMFRTWHATVAAAGRLGEEGPQEKVTARRRSIRAAMEEAAEILGNTPAQARTSYVDPRVVDLYEQGVTVTRQEAMTRGTPRSRRLERAVLRLLKDA